MINPVAYSLGANRSCIRDLFEYGRQRAAIVGEENVFDYSLGNPSIPAPAEVNETIRAILSDTDSLQIHGYTSAIGDAAMRKAIADDLNERFSANAAPEDFFIGSGAAPELISVLRALAVENGEILAIAPYFPEYKPFSEANGLNFKVVPADIPGFQINFAALEEMLSPNTQVIIINSPNNPSGVVYTRETLEKLAALLEKKSAEIGHPIYIISDEPYRELVYGGVEVPFIPNIYPNTVVYQEDMKLKDYIEQAGGYTDKAKKSKVFAVNMDGTVTMVKKAKDIRPGAQIVVPTKEEREKLNFTQYISIFSTIAMMGSVIATLLK